MKALLIVCFAMPALCQSVFTIASLKLTEFLPDKRAIVTLTPGRLNLIGLTLQDLIARAYGVKEFQVRGAEAVLHERYTIAATMPPETPEPVIWQMLQQLLTERLQLRLRHASEKMSVYAIVPAKSGPKLKLSTGGELSVRIHGGAIEGKNVTMRDFASVLGGLFDCAVIDQTGIEGAYDIALGFTPDATLGPGMSKMSVEMEAEGGAGGQSIFGALQQQLGLRLQAGKAPVEVLVVESVLKAPIEN